MVVLSEFLTRESLKCPTTVQINMPRTKPNRLRFISSQSGANRNKLPGENFSQLILDLGRIEPI